MATRPAPVNDILRDEVIAHALQIERLKNAEQRAVIEFVQKSLLPDLTARLEQRVVDIDTRGIDVGPDTTARLKLLIQSLSEIVESWTNRLARDILSRSAEIAGFESQWTTSLLNDQLETVPVRVSTILPPVEQLRTLILSRPVDGVLIESWIERLNANTKASLDRQIRLGIAAGESTPKIVRRVREVTGLARDSAVALTRTVVAHAATIGRDAVYEANADLLRGVQWHATLDTRTCARCGKLDGQFYKLGDGPRPPLHVQCFPGDTLVSSSYGITGVTKRWHDGEMIVIRTAGNKKITVTGNHPILTRRGWVGAYAVKTGDDLVGQSIQARSLGFTNTNHHHVPTRIEEIAKAFIGSSKMRSAEVPITAKDFHGDGRDGEVAVIATNRLLGDRADASLNEFKRQASLILRNMRLALLTSASKLQAMAFRLLDSTGGTVCGTCQSFSLVRIGSLHTNELLACGVADGFTRFNQNAFYDATTQTQFLRHAQDTATGSIQPDDFLDRQARFTTQIRKRHELDTSFGEATTNSVASDRELAGDLLNGHFGPIEFDNIVSCEVIKFSGHVYNLETETGFYQAEGLIVHNCRCSTVPVLKSWRQLGIKANDIDTATRASMDGQVSSSITYGDWLSRRSASEQDNVLGKTRARLFRSGALQIGDFVNSANEVITLDALKARHSDAFRKAGI